jgi:hypothetical protein
MRLEYEPRFLDDVVRRAVARRPEWRRFHRECEAIYAIADPEGRTAAFDALNLVWCARLELGRVLEDAIAEEPRVLAAIDRCAVGRMRAPSDAGAELIVRTPAPGTNAPVVRVLRFLLSPEWLLEPAVLTPLLRRELRHVADMLDPAFGYEPRLPGGGPGRTHERLVRDRYRAAWNASVNGRLVREGKLDASARERSWEEFTAVFGTLDDAAPGAFAELFADLAPTHAGLIALATAPRAVVVGPEAGPVACPLCGCPSAWGLVDGATLDVASRMEIGGDFPDWTPRAGCCRQCADLYAARRLSRAEAASLPGIR